MTREVWSKFDRNNTKKSIITLTLIFKFNHAIGKFLKEVKDLHQKLESDEINKILEDLKMEHNYGKKK